VGRCDAHLNEAAHLLDILLLDEAGRVEMLDLAGDLAVERRRIEGLDARYTVAAFEQGLPCMLRGVTNRGQKTDAGDYNSAGNNRSPLARLAGLMGARAWRGGRYCPPALSAFLTCRPGRSYFFLLSI
jgi:hypothetical protein